MLILIIIPALVFSLRELDKGMRLKYKRYKSRNRRAKKVRLSHRKRIIESQKILERICSLDGETKRLLPKIIGMLRNTNPYTFEELVLTAAEHQGTHIKAIRNPSYSNDGGIDGKLIIYNQEYLVQSKRYNRPINPEHISIFAADIKNHDATGGYFVHAGRTGRRSHKILDQHPEIHLISGIKLVELMRRTPGTI